MLILMVDGLIYKGQGQEVNQEEASRREEAMDNALHADDSVHVSGEQLQAFEAAYAKFKQRADVTIVQKRLTKYTVNIGEDAKNIYIYFIAAAPPMQRDKEGRLLFTPDAINPNGIGITYFVRRKDCKVYYELLNH